MFKDIASTPRRSDVLFSHLTYNKPYTFRFVDVMHRTEESTASRSHSHYFTLEGFPEENYTCLGVKSDEAVKVHFPQSAFQRAWDRCPDRPKPLNKKGHYDLIITFVRQSRKSLKFLKLEVKKFTGHTGHAQQKGLNSSDA